MTPSEKVGDAGRSSAASGSALLEDGRDATDEREVHLKGEGIVAKNP